MAIAILAGQPADDCGRYRRFDLQPCEVRRDRRADILNAARRPLARSLGREVIRVSRQPALGGHGLVVELVGNEAGGATVRIFGFYGHPRTSWRRTGMHRFILPSEQYRQLADSVDRAMVHNVPPRLAQGEVVVCTDGPGLLTERVRDGAVRSLGGSCPLSVHAEHPNRVIEAAVQDMLCRRGTSMAEPAYWSGRRCFASLRTMVQRDAADGP